MSIRSARLHPVFTQLVILLAAIALSMPAWSSDNSISEIEPSGAACTNVDLNSLSMTSGTLSGTGVLQGPPNPNNQESEGESANWATENFGTVISFSGATTPIDYAIVSAYEGFIRRAYIYKTGEVVADGNITLTAYGNDWSIDSLSLCYGLGNEPEPLAEIPVCDASLCGTEKELITIASLDPNARKYDFGTDGSAGTCVCNNLDEGGVAQPLLECDGDLGSLDVPLPGQPGPCVLPGDQDQVESESDQGVETNSSIEYSPDPYVCVTVGGRRTCYRY